MQIVATHNSLDFDALAAAFAITKLNPTARMALPYPVLGNVRDFLTLHRNNLPLVPIKHLKDKAKEIKKIFLVDCQHMQRLDPAIQQLIKAGIPYAVFDHHEFDDHKNGLGVNAQTDSIIECVGAATTLVVEQIISHGIKLNSFEASLLALGIYEDTGALTYASTTYRDAACVTFLLQAGADLQLINQYMRTKLTEAQQGLFEQLVSHARVINIAGNRIVFAAAHCDEYLDGLAILTRKLMEVESADATFTAVYMRDRIYLVGRSDSPTISARDVARLYDGDGHTGAASAVIKSLDKSHPPSSSTAMILDNIEEYLRKNIQPELTAAQIMTPSAKMILPSVSMEEAGKIMIRHDLDGLLVAEDKKILGVISKRDVDQAQHHQLGHAPVSGFMSRPVIAVKPNITLSEIQSLLTSNSIGRVPVLDNEGNLLGLISRSNISQTLFNKSPFNKKLLPIVQPILPIIQAADKQENFTEFQPAFNLQDPLQALTALDADNLWLYHEIGSVSAELGMTAYAVGGSVRDMLLGLKNFDLDFVIEGSAISVAEKLANKYPDKILISNRHERFQTATLSFMGPAFTGTQKRMVDLSTARQEFYEYPAALPTVEPSLLKEDISRRDFTINTLALSLHSDNFGNLINYFNGLEDLRLGIIRVLHQFSFIEDPTRILRAARFASRFAFSIDQNTAQLASHAIEMGIFDNLAGVRMKEELRLILESPARLEALKILSELGAKLRYLDEELEYGPEQRKLIRRAQQLLARYPLNNPDKNSPDKNNHNKSNSDKSNSDRNNPDTWLIYLALLLSRLPCDRLENVLARLHLASEARDSIAHGLSIDEQLLHLGKNPKRSQIYALLHTNNDISLAIAACLSAPGSPTRRAIKLYFEQLKEIKTDLDGADLLKLGLKEGREFGKVLQSLLTAKLDKVVNNRQEELAFIKSEIATGTSR